MASSEWRVGSSAVYAAGFAPIVMPVEGDSPRAGTQSHKDIAQLVALGPDSCAQVPNSRYKPPG